MRIYNFFAVLLLSVLMLFSCSKSTGMEEPVDPQKIDPETPTAKLPNITFGKPATKAMLNDADLKTVNSRIKVYDLLSNYTGTTIEGWNQATKPYIDEEIIYNNTEVWKYASEGIYPWTANGTHKFFGYLTHDQSSGLDVTSICDTTGWYQNIMSSFINVPSISFTTETTQFDFLYSDAVERNAASKDYSVVPLNFRHLFTSLGLIVESKTKTKVYLKSIQLEGLKNKKNAKIQFASSGSSVSYLNAGVDGPFFPDMTSEKLLNEDDVYDVLSGTYYPKATLDADRDTTFRMLWPQLVGEVSPSSEDAPSTDSLIVVEYDLEVNGVREEHSTRIKFPNYAWEAGKKMFFRLQFGDKRISLTSVVLPWDYNEYNVDYSEGAIVVTQQLKFYGETCLPDPDTKTVTVVNGDSPIGYFKIVAPVGGTWMVGMTGDTEYFSISPSSGSIDPHGEDAGLVNITITPNLTLDRPTDKKIKLKFTVITSDNREVDAQSEINRDNWTILLPK